MPKLRLGVALLLPSPVAEEVDGLRRALGDGSLGRIPPHLTLVPPVNVRHEHLGRALAVLRAAAAGTPPHLSVSLGPPTSFLPDNAVLYLPILAGFDAIHALRARVWEPPLTRPLTWPFVAHVTLADEASASRIEAATAALAGYQAEATFDSVVLLVERRAEGGGAVWEPLADAAFGPPSIVARAGPLALEMVRSRYLDPEAEALLAAEGVQAPGQGVFVTARREGEVVGVAHAHLTLGRCDVGVVVAAEHRNQGIGRHLDAALETAVANAGWDCQTLGPW